MIDYKKMIYQPINLIRDILSNPESIKMAQSGVLRSGLTEIVADLTAVSRLSSIQYAGLTIYYNGKHVLSLYNKSPSEFDTTYSRRYLTCISTELFPIIEYCDYPITGILDLSCSTDDFNSKIFQLSTIIDSDSVIHGLEMARCLYENGIDSYNHINIYTPDLFIKNHNNIITDMENLI